MITVPFDVNDPWLRKTFLSEILPDRIGHLADESGPVWGAMTARHMVEHLLWAFEVSDGKLDVRCATPEKLLERSKRFLYSTAPTPRGFRNPLLGDVPPPYRFPGLREAVDALRKELTTYGARLSQTPDLATVHPVFGLIGMEEWDRAHFKHTYHHLLQFNLIREPKLSDAMLSD